MTKTFLKISTGIFLLLLVSIPSKILISQEYSTGQREILELKDQRVLGKEDKLILYAHSTDTVLRQTAIYALADIADSSFVSKINYLLGGPFKEYPSTEDIKAISFMFGQILSAESRNNLTLMLQNSQGYSNLEKSYLIHSIGKNGDENNFKTIIDFYNSDVKNDPVLMQAVAMSLARFGIRKIKSEQGIEVLRNIANNTKDTLALRYTAFAFWRIGDKGLLENAKQEIFTLAESKDPQTRMWAFNAMGKLQDEVMLLYLLENFDSEKDWRVQVNVLNSLTNFKIDSLPHLSEKIISVLGGYKDKESEHVSITRLNVIGKVYGGKKFSDSVEVKKGLIEIIHDKEYTYRIRSEAANSLSLIFGDETRKDLLNAFSKTDEYNLKAGIIRAFGNFSDGKVYKEVRDSISVEVQRYNLLNPNTTGEMIGSKDLALMYRAFVEMLSSLDDKVDDDDRNIIRLIFLEFAGSGDPAIVDVSLTSLRDSLYLNDRIESNVVLNFDYVTLQYPKDTDIIYSFVDAMNDLNNESTIELLEKNLTLDNYELAKLSAEVLEKITGKKYEFSAKPKTNFDWSYIENMSQKKIVNLKTNKGDIKIELLPDVAPFTVQNFLKLAEKNFYDGTPFHRVVSNFVIQGGDPTGTGYGGPGYTIRSEFSPLTYERGMVGMASSGKDTEGSQFFIMHSSAPHLDGRYTIFGRVIEGMDIVDKIMIGDSVEDIILSNY